MLIKLTTAEKLIMITLWSGFSWKSDQGKDTAPETQE
jgi:hypothetical protein